jgi:hypothetical protein
MGRGGKRNGDQQDKGNHKYVESCKDHVDRIEEDLSSMEQLTLACLEAVTEGDKQLAIEKMRAAVGISLEVRHKREQFRQANAQLKELEEQAKQGEWAKTRIERVEASRKEIHDWFKASPIDGVPELADENAAVDPLLPDPSYAAERGEYNANAEEAAARGGPMTEGRVRPSTNRQILGNLSNPRR